MTGLVSQYGGWRTSWGFSHLDFLRGNPWKNPAQSAIMKLSGSWPGSGISQKKQIERVENHAGKSDSKKEEIRHADRSSREGAFIFCPPHDLRQPVPTALQYHRLGDRGPLRRGKCPGGRGRVLRHHQRVHRHCHRRRNRELGDHLPVSGSGKDRENEDSRIYDHDQFPGDLCDPGDRWCCF